MSSAITTQNLEDAKKLYLDTVPELVEIRERASEKSKIISAQKRIFKTYMKQHNLTSLEVGTTTFAMEEEEKVACSMESVEKFFPEELVIQFKRSNKKRKTTFKEIRD